MSVYNTVWNPHTPSDDNIEGNKYAYCIDLTQPWFSCPGRDDRLLRADAVHRADAALQGGLLQMVAQQFSAPCIWPTSSSPRARGKLVIGDRGWRHQLLRSRRRQPHHPVGESAGLPADPSMNQSIVPGFVTLIGSGKFLASSSGPVMFIEPPVRVDPEALVGLTDVRRRAITTTKRGGERFHRRRRRRMGINSGENAVRFHRRRNGTGAVEREGHQRQLDRPVDPKALAGLSAPGLQQINQQINNAARPASTASDKGSNPASAAQPPVRCGTMRGVFR